MRGGGVSHDTSSTCVQGDIPRSTGGYEPNIMMQPSSPAPAWQFHSTLPKTEPMDHEDRNDSGITSGSDFHSSSPGSDNNENIPHSSPSANQTTHPVPHSGYYSTPLASINQLSAVTHRQPQVFTDHNLLTPPRSEPSPKETITSTSDEEKSTDAVFQTALTQYQMQQAPLNAQPLMNNAEHPLKKLEMAFQRNNMQSSPSYPKSESDEDENKFDNDADDYDEQGIRVPKVNSHGKVKTFKCKQCSFVAFIKSEFWAHVRIHIPPEKLLTCPQCPFVTEYKHHLEYHLRNHTGSKPFKCDQCEYSCVNKSMLNSHLKSHSNIYQYRCSNCSYATKYCHSLKLHLRKYKHKPAMVLNPDGTPNPLPIIDVYGTRRGPKVKPQEQKSEEQSIPQPPQALPFNFNQMVYNPLQMQLPFPGFPLLHGLSNPLLLQNLEQIAKAQASFLPPKDNMDTSESSQPDSEVLDLSKPDQSTPRNRRKGRAFKLTPTPDCFSDDDDDQEMTTIFSNVEVVEEKQAPKDEATPKEEDASNNNNTNKPDFACHYCNIKFGEQVLYTIHMGYHGYKNPFTCNMCGEECNDKISFFIHIATRPHS